MKTPRIFTMPFAAVYPFYVQKAEKKGRTKIEDKLMQKIRRLDLLVDEPAGGKTNRIMF